MNLSHLTGAANFRAFLAGVVAALGLSLVAVPLSAREGPQAQSAASASAAPNPQGYVGDAACLSCHKEQALSYLSTSHHLTSQPPGRRSILGSFASGSNLLPISTPEANSPDPRLSFEMQAKQDGFYEKAVAELGAKRLEHTARIDLVIGSGVRGQTYLYWAGDQLFELPVSFWSDGRRWINSPGYKDGTANFDRRVDARCLECHTSYIRSLSEDPHANVYDRATLLTGIACETCHGSGAAHVARENRPASYARSSGHAILNPASFGRDRQIDLCALCHNGTQREELARAFSYLPGKPLDEYLAPNPFDVAEHPDVHGNQVGLLKRSRCFINSPAMTCSTCHDVHAPEHAAADYSQRCLSCHRWQSCGMSRKIGHEVTRNCVDCHMPVQPTEAIVSQTAGQVIRASIRTHWIKVYPQH